MFNISKSYQEFCQETNQVYYTELGEYSNSFVYRYENTIDFQSDFINVNKSTLAKTGLNIEPDEYIIVEISFPQGIDFDNPIYDHFCYLQKIGQKLPSCIDNYKALAIENCIKGLKSEYRNYIPLFFVYKFENSLTDDFLPFLFDLIEKPFSWAKEEKKPKRKSISKPIEKELENELLEWLHLNGVQADNQIKTQKHRLDIWIPSKCFLELKRDKVTGDDACQAIDYCAEHKLPVIIVGNNISDMASRGIVAFNKAIKSDLITFVQWSAIKVYLKGLLSLR